MNINVGDLFIIKGKEPDVPHISFIITEEHILYYNITMYYSDGNIKKQTLDSHVIEHYVKQKEFIHYPVKE